MSADVAIREIADRLRSLLFKMLGELEVAIANGGDSNIIVMRRKVLRFAGELAIFLPN